jgi:hypothetical protein
MKAIRCEISLNGLAALARHASQRPSGWIGILYDWVFPLGVFVVFLMPGKHTVGIRIASGLITAGLVRLLMISPIARWLAHGVM